MKLSASLRAFWGTKKSRMILLLFGVVVYSVVSVLAKLAAGHPFLSWTFWLYWGFSLLLAGVYAVIWQLALEKLSLLVAYPIVYLRDILVLVWSIVIFSEAVKPAQFLGAVLIIVGVGVSQIERK